MPGVRLISKVCSPFFSGTLPVSSITRRWSQPSETSPTFAPPAFTSSHGLVDGRLAGTLDGVFDLDLVFAVPRRCRG